MASRQIIRDALACGQSEHALLLCQQALATGENGDLRYLMGMALYQSGRRAEALAAFRQAVELHPDHADSAFAAGVVEQEAGELGQAIGHWRRAAALGHGGALYNLARALSECGELAEAAELYAALLVQQPDHLDALYNLGNVCYRLSAFTRAQAAFQHLLRLRPDFASGWVNLAITLDIQGETAAAEAAYRQGLVLEPMSIDAHWNLALNLLAQAKWAEGGAEFEWRLRLPDAPPVPVAVPRWRGDEPPGSRVLVWNDQGIGDAIHFLRHVQALAERGYEVVLLVQDALASLAATAPGVTAAFGVSQPLPAVDCHLPLLSLPYALGLAEPLAWSGAYLRAEVPAPRREGPRRIGLVWAGNPQHRNDRARSMPVSCIEPLLACPDVAWFSLQVGAAAYSIQGDGRITDLATQLTDFRATAAMVAQLDLVISVDTSVAHLAGALGCPVWLLLPSAGLDWRWPRQGAATPLYPSMRLFRQSQPGDWAGVVQQVMDQL